MPVILEHGEAKSLIRLEGTVEIASAADLKKVLVEALGSTRELPLSPKPDRSGCDGRSAALGRRTRSESLWHWVRARSRSAGAGFINSCECGLWVFPVVANDR